MKIKNFIIVMMGIIIVMMLAFIVYVSSYVFVKSYFVDSKPQTSLPTERVTNVTEVYERNIDSIVSVVNTATVEFLKNNKGEPLFSQEVMQGVGTGFIYDYEGGYYYGLTNYHVIKDNSEIRLIFKDDVQDIENALVAEVVGFSELDDIAVFRFKSKTDIQPVALGDSDLVVPGEDAIAMGSPYGLEFSGSITKGIVSSTKRLVENESGELAEYIQTDAAINPGNSGGPLFNASGEVIGMNTMKIADAQSDNIGLAIPINYVMEISERIRNGEEFDQKSEDTYTIEDFLNEFLK